jgi:exodeoxyribonuclease VII small subunit
MTDDPDAMAEDPAAGYAAAMAELEQILGDLERADLDVDQLGAKVARAAELIRSCRARISTARLEVEQIVADLDDPPLP